MRLRVRPAGWRLIGLVGLVIIMGCAEQPPAWIAKVPGSTGELCAVGVSGPTYYREDARANSKAAAMTELARAKEVHVKSHVTLQMSGDAQGADSAVQESAGFTSDVVLKEAYVREQWVHSGGDTRYGEQGTVYTLVCLRVPRQAR